MGRKSPQRRTAIGTVQIVTWTLDVADLTEAHIAFGPTGAAITTDLARRARMPNRRAARRWLGRHARSRCRGTTLAARFGAVDE